MTGLGGPLGLPLGGGGGGGPPPDTLSYAGPPLSGATGTTVSSPWVADITDEGLLGTLKIELWVEAAYLDHNFPDDNSSAGTVSVWVDFGPGPRKAGSYFLSTYPADPPEAAVPYDVTTDAPGAILLVPVPVVVGTPTVTAWLEFDAGVAAGPGPHEMTLIAADLVLTGVITTDTPTTLTYVGPNITAQNVALPTWYPYYIPSLETVTFQLTVLVAGQPDLVSILVDAGQGQFLAGQVRRRHFSGGDISFLLPLAEPITYSGTFTISSPAAIVAVTISGAGVDAGEDTLHDFTLGPATLVILDGGIVGDGDVPDAVGTVPPSPTVAERGDDINVRLDLPGRSFGLADGARNIGNALARRLTTPRGGLLYDPSYGTDVRNYLNAGFTPAQVARVKSEVAAEVMQDPRVSSVAVDVTVAGAGSMTITIEAELEEGPFEFVFVVDKLTVALLDARAL